MSTVGTHVLRTKTIMLGGKLWLAAVDGILHRCRRVHVDSLLEHVRLSHRRRYGLRILHRLGDWLCILDRLGSILNRLSILSGYGSGVDSGLRLHGGDAGGFKGSPIFSRSHDPGDH